MIEVAVLDFGLRHFLVIHEFGEFVELLVALGHRRVGLVAAIFLLRILGIVSIGALLIIADLDRRASQPAIYCR